MKNLLRGCAAGFLACIAAALAQPDRNKPADGPAATTAAEVGAPVNQAASSTLTSQDAFFKHLWNELRRRKELVAREPGAAGRERGALELFVPQGNDTQAKAYYDRISKELNFTVEGSTLDALITYLGWEGLGAADLEIIPSAGLMPASPEQFTSLAGQVADKAKFSKNFTLDAFTGGAILSSRFLAPKIVDVTGRPPYKAGWRKLVRLRARPASEALAAGIEAAHILFNYTREQSEIDPFSNIATDASRASKNNQVILVPKTGAALSDAVYWVVYGPKGDGYRSVRFLGAVFDLPTQPDAVSPGQYFVPNACANCHGHDDLGGGSSEGVRFARAKLNYLDTDHWHDRAQKGDYFAEAGATAGVLIDGGKDQSSERYKAAFQIIRTLNDEIIAQNERSQSDPKTPSFQLRAARKWRSVHFDFFTQTLLPAHAPPLQRALGEGSHVWTPPEDPLDPFDLFDPNNQDESTLTLLNKYCFRCHSSIRYNVFDKEAVISKKFTILFFLEFGVMPQGQDMTQHEPADLARLISLIKGLPEPPR